MASMKLGKKVIISLKKKKKPALSGHGFSMGVGEVEKPRAKASREFSMHGPAEIEKPRVKKKK